MPCRTITKSVRAQWKSAERELGALLLHRLCIDCDYESVLENGRTAAAKMPDNRIFEKAKEESRSSPPAFRQHRTIKAAVLCGNFVS